MSDIDAPSADPGAFFWLMIDVKGTYATAQRSAGRRGNGFNSAQASLSLGSIVCPSASAVQSGMEWRAPEGEGGSPLFSPERTRLLLSPLRGSSGPSGGK